MSGFLRVNEHPVEHVARAVPGWRWWTWRPWARSAPGAALVEGLSGGEAAALLGIGVAAMKSRLHPARMTLAEAVRKDAPCGRTSVQ